MPMVRSMKRRGVLLLEMILLCIAGAAGQSQQPTKPPAKQQAASATIDTSTWKTYRNEKYGFEVKYPDTWTVQSSSGTGPDIIHLRGPVRAGEPGVYVALAIQKDQNPKRLSIDKWFADQLQATKSSPESSGHLTIGGQAAIFMENTNSFGKNRGTFTVLNETDILSFSYVRRSEVDSTYAAIVSSFRVVK